MCKQGKVIYVAPERIFNILLDILLIECKSAKSICLFSR